MYLRKRNRIIQKNDCRLNQQILKKIVVTGPESTGKSTLAQQLAAHYDTVWVPEFAREYLAGLNRKYREEDLLAIARGQMEREDAIARNARKGLLICDTGLYVIKVWSEYKYGRCHPWILQEIAKRYYDLFLLCNIDMPWTPDSLREHPDPAMREYFFKVYQETLSASGLPFAVVNGIDADRLDAAVEIINTVPGRWKGG